MKWKSAYSCWRPWHWSEKHVTTGPGRGRYVCAGCPSSDWREAMGFKPNPTPISKGSKTVRYVGEPFVTDSRYGGNAFGSVLAELENGSRIGVTCEHGGSEWLCLSCAEAVNPRRKP